MIDPGRVLVMLAALAVVPASSSEPPAAASSSDSRHADGPPGMVWVPGGELTMGSAGREARPDEQPPHRVRVDGFWMDATEVTNIQFREFVEATGYVTTAERTPSWDELSKQLPPGTPKPPPEMLVPGSLVFTPPAHPVSVQDVAAYWSWVAGANWRHPEGPGSSIDGKADHPVVQVSYEDALAYCAWAGKRLPTEAEWEFAARGGLESKPYVWGDKLVSEDRPAANIWQGRFPHHNVEADGFATTAPVKSFHPNAYGLYDMAGNVWEWCSDWYRHDTYRRRVASLGAGGVAVNPIGPTSPFDPQEPTMPKRVQRGGSFLCHASYCAGYRPAARMKASPDTSLQHSDFRCVMTPEMLEADAPQR